MRDTDYARELASVTKEYPDGDEARIERLFVKELGQEEIRFSWWQNGRMIPRPLDLPEADLLELLKEGMAKGVFSEAFATALRD